MLCKQLISPLVPSLALHDTADKALSLMEDYHLTQLPLVEENHYLGLVNEDALLDWDNGQLRFSEASTEYTRPAVNENAHIYEAVKLQLEYATNILPVITEQNIYLGSITQESLLQYLAQGVQSTENGGIVVISTTDRNYSLGQISRIFESENVTILSMQMHVKKGTEGGIVITLKTNKHDLRALIATLERLNYTIEEVHSEMNDMDDLQSNYESFLRYLDV